MAELFYVALTFLLVLSLVGIDAIRRAKRRRFIIKENMPEELATGRLIHSEHYIKTDAPRMMHGTLDQLYKLVSGLQVLVDSKTRQQHRVYRKDIVQVSVYNVILRNKGHKTADYAYFRVVTPEGVKYIKKMLLSEQEVVAEYDRTNELLTRKTQPGYAEHVGMCRSCGQRTNCDRWQLSA